MNKQERNKAHVKMLLNATMSEVCQEYNPPLQEAFGNLAAFTSHIETTIQEHGGWQPDILEAVMENLTLDHLGDEVNEFTEDQMMGFKDIVMACLEKGIGQDAIFEAFEEFVEEERDKIERQHGVRLE